MGFRKPTGTATSAQVLSGYTFSNDTSDGLSGSYAPRTGNATAAQVLSGYTFSNASSNNLTGSYVAPKGMNQYTNGELFLYGLLFVELTNDLGNGYNYDYDPLTCIKCNTYLDITKISNCIFTVTGYPSDYLTDIEFYFYMSNAQSNGVQHLTGNWSKNQYMSLTFSINPRLRPNGTYINYSYVRTYVVLYNGVIIRNFHQQLTSFTTTDGKVHTLANPNY